MVCSKQRLRPSYDGSQKSCEFEDARSSRVSGILRCHVSHLTLSKTHSDSKDQTCAWVDIQAR